MSAVTLDLPFLHQTTKQLWIDGRQEPSATGEAFDTLNPATGEAIASLARGSASDIDRAVASARRAFEGSWSSWTPYDRQRLFARITTLVEENFEELARIETLDMGAPLSRTRSLKGWLLQALSFYATQTVNMSGATLKHSLPGGFTTSTLKAPVGVVGGIIPWNGPLISQWWVLGPVLATGCTLVLKPAEEASLSVLRMVELLYEAGLPEGVVNVVTGYGEEAGAALAAHMDVDRIAFTGSTETGRKIVTASGSNMKRVQLELGGKSPDIVFADADFETAVPGAAMAAFANSGQICFAGTRLLVERSVYEEFTEKLVAFTKSLRVGDGLQNDVQLGPIVSEKQLAQVTNYVRLGSQEGANLLVGGTRLGGSLSKGYFFEPTVFADVDNGMTVAQEEIFGPVVSIIPFEDETEALGLANATRYGLGSAIWSRDVSRVLRMSNGLKAGTVWINCYGQLDPSIGFACHKMSGYGVKGGPQHVEGYLYQKTLYMKH